MVSFVVNKNHDFESSLKDNPLIVMEQMTNWAATQNDDVFTCHVIVKPAWICMGKSREINSRIWRCHLAPDLCRGRWWIALKSGPGSGPVLRTKNHFTQASFHWLVTY